jgi:hypothetical protein
MAGADDVLDIARHMIEQHGDCAAELMDKRAQEHRDVGEFEGAAFWSRVAEAVRVLQGHKPH